MRFLVMAGGVAMTAMLAGTGNAEAARWCAGASDACFSSYRACVQSTGAAGGCRREAANSTRGGLAGWQTEFPGRPPNASPYTCYFDEGYGRYRPCDAGGGPP